MENAKQYDQANTQIWLEFQKYAFQLINAGNEKIGAKQIFERIRWDSMIVRGRNKFKVNNNFSPYYARKFEEVFPIYKGIFSMREIKMK